MSRKSRRCSKSWTSKSVFAQCRNTSQRSSRSRRSNRRLQKDVASQFSDAQRRAYLRSQLKAIQHELGEAEGGSEEQAQQLRKRLEEAKPPPEVMKQAERELKRLDFIPSASPEFSVIVSYIEIIADLPWNKLSKDNLDLDQAQQILDRDHYDLEKVKKRLIEYLAVRKLNPQGHGAILCFLGPPGVGKTSLGQSIADALGRKFVRISLGGMRDEAEIRGHRRTYIGSMPGRIIQELRRAGRATPCSCSMRSTRSARIFAATRPARCSKCSIRGKTTRLSIATSTCRLIFRR